VRETFHDQSPLRRDVCEKCAEFMGSSQRALSVSIEVAEPLLEIVQLENLEIVADLIFLGARSDDDDRRTDIGALAASAIESSLAILPVIGKGQRLR
jgi:hypothetical protein